MEEKCRIANIDFLPNFFNIFLFFMPYQKRASFAIMPNFNHICFLENKNLTWKKFHFKS